MAIEHSFLVSFKIISEDDNLTPDNISKITGITPSKSIKKGDLNTRISQIQQFRYNSWILDSSVDTQASLDKHLLSLINMIGNSATQIAELSKKANISFLITSHVFKLEISPEIMRKIAQLGVTIYINNVAGLVTITNLNNSDIKNANLERIKLVGANLLHSNLESSNLRTSDLSHSNLSNSYLMGADLSGAFLKYTNLSDVWARRVNFSGANLSNANLCGADLSQANLEGVNLSGAIFDEFTVLPDARRLRDEGNNEFIVENDKFVYSKYWTQSVDMERYSNRNHSEFWQPKWVLDS